MLFLALILLAVILIAVGVFTVKFVFYAGLILFIIAIGVYFARHT